jgi:hypothetical protein
VDPDLLRGQSTITLTAAKCGLKQGGFDQCEEPVVRRQFVARRPGQLIVAPTRELLLDLFMSRDR